MNLNGAAAKILHNLSGVISSHSFFNEQVSAATFLYFLLQNLLEILPKLHNCKNVAALTRALKKEGDEIIPDNVCDICATAPCGIKAVVQNGGGYIE